jgi:hypothetical protein
MDSELELSANEDIFFGIDFNNHSILIFQVPPATFSSCDKLLLPIQSSNFPPPFTLTSRGEERK